MLNKIDLVRDEEGNTPASYEEAVEILEAAGPRPANVVLISAERRWGLDELRARIAAALDGSLDAGGSEEPEHLLRAVAPASATV